MAIKLEYVPVASYEKKKECHHNNACECSTKDCYRCGWNPVVAKMRLDNILGRKSEG